MADSERARRADGEGYPAVVAPGPQLSEQQRARAARQLSLPGFGEQAQRRLAAARVLVIGAGGLGSASVPYLAGAGIGTIGVVDDDTVELSNLHRQVAHGTADVGRAKTTSLAETVAALDPNVRVIEHRERLTSKNALEVFSGYDLIIDGSDNFPTRYLTNDAAMLTGIPLVWGAILQHHGQVGVAWHEHGPGYRDLFPSPPAPGTVPDCAAGGVLPGLCGTVGSLLATEALKLITGIGTPLVGRVLVYDALAARTREITYGRDPSAAPVTELIDYELFCGSASSGSASSRSASSGAAGAGAAGEALTSVSAAELASVLRSGRPVVLIDVRTREEREAESIVGSSGVPLDEVELAAVSGSVPGEVTRMIAGAGAGAGAGADTDADAPGDTGGTASAAEVFVHCAREPRSIRAAQLFASAGLRTRFLAGGIHEFARVAPELIERNS